MEVFWAVSNIIDFRYVKEHIKNKKISKLASIIGVDYITVYRVFNKQRNPGKNSSLAF